MFTNMPKCDTVAREHDEHCEHASNMVSNTSNICSPEHMFSNMPEHAFCIWHGLDLGRFFFGLVAATSHDEIVALQNPWREHASNMARTCLEHGMAHAAPIVRTAECSFLPFDNYTISSILMLQTQALGRFVLLPVRQFHKFQHSNAQSANGSPIRAALPKMTSLEHMFYSNMLEHMFFEHMFTNMSNMSNICS